MTPPCPWDAADLVRVTGHEEMSEAERDEAVGHLRHDIYLDHQPIRPAGVEWLNEAQLRVTLTEGRHRQIRRMCDLVGWKAVAIKRVRKQDASGKLALEPYLMTIEPAVPANDGWRCTPSMPYSRRNPCTTTSR